MYINKLNDKIFEQINYISQDIFLPLLSTTSTYYALLGANRENKQLKNYFKENNPTDLEYLIETTINGNHLSWGKKYHPQRETFSDIKVSTLKKTTNERSFHPFYYYNQNSLEYKNGDYTDFYHSDIYLYKTFYKRQSVFLKTFIYFRFITWQKQGRDKVSNFEKLFSVFIKDYKFKNIKVKDIESKIIEDESQLHIFNKTHLEQEFFIRNNVNELTSFNDVNKEDMEFLLLLGEIFSRLYLTNLINHKSQSFDNIDNSGVLFIENIIDDYYLQQLINNLPNIQFFINNNKV